MFLFPILEFNGRVLMLSNVAKIHDDSAENLPLATITTKAGGEIQFSDDDAEALFEELETLLQRTDPLRFPIVGLEKTVLILPNFVMFEIIEPEDAAGPAAITLTDEALNDHTFTNDHAAAIIARLDTLTAGTKQLFDQLTAPAAGA